MSLPFFTKYVCDIDFSKPPSSFISQYRHFTLGCKASEVINYLDGVKSASSVGVEFQNLVVDQNSSCNLLFFTSCSACCKVSYLCDVRCYMLDNMCTSVGNLGCVEVNS